MSDAPHAAPCSECQRVVADRLDAIERKMREHFSPTLDDHEDRLDKIEPQLDTVRRDLIAVRADMGTVRSEVSGLRTDVGRIANAQTAQSLLQEKTFDVLATVSKHVKRLIEIQEPRSIIVEASNG
jgi:archaellum component FlaC